MSYLRRSPATDSTGTSGGGAVGGAWSTQLPALVEFLAASAWPDGGQRTPGSLTLFSDSGQWKLCLSDRAQGLIAFVTGQCPQTALEGAERGLVAGTLDWRAQRPNAKGGRGR